MAILYVFYVTPKEKPISKNNTVQILSMNEVHVTLITSIRKHFRKLQLFNLKYVCDEHNYDFTNSPKILNSIFSKTKNVIIKAEDIVYIELYKSKNGFATKNIQQQQKNIIRLISFNKLLQFLNSKYLDLWQSIIKYLRTLLYEYIINSNFISSKKTLSQKRNVSRFKKIQKTMLRNNNLLDNYKLANDMKILKQIVLFMKYISRICNTIGTRLKSSGNCHCYFLPILQRIYLLLILLSTFWHKSECFHGNFKQSSNIVKTKYGLLRGIVLHSSPLVEAYLGIPYATPPVGSLRFMPPITPSSWKNVRVADRFSAACPQIVPVPPNGPEALLEIPRARLAQLRRLSPLLKNQSEDCLYLNIYAPYDEQRRYTALKNSEFHNTSSTTRRNLSTILFIHGESYDWNSGNPYDGSELASNGNVIVVTINFRLGILGFLKTGGKESAQGNYGLMDLVAGLHWLKENLPAFGGDPQSITIIGHGTGAALANILVVSPVSSDLIQRVVLVSGSALSPWALQKNPLFVKRRVAEQTGCHGDMLFDDLAPCLRTKSVQELLSVKIDHPRFLVGFAPFIDGTVIHTNAHISESLTTPSTSTIASTSGIEFANFPKRDLIFCLTSVESYLDLSAQDLEFGFNETRRDRILRTFVRNNFHYHLNEIFAILKNEYTDWEKAIRNPLSSRDATLAFLSDGHTASTLIKLGYMHSLRGGHSYFLHFKHKTAEEEYPQRAGSVRGEDVPFWLGLPSSPLFPHNYTIEEKQISYLMVNYLANFAKTGNPNQSTHSSEDSPANPITPVSDSNNIILDRPRHSFDTPKRKRSSAVFQKNINTNKIRNITIPLVHNKKRLTSEADTIEMIHLAVIYNQRRINSLREHRTALKRHMRSNSNNDYKTDQSNNLQEKKDANANLPFWDAYDSVNQLYLEIGTYTVVQSHYRGHKLSMWLNLIPQLHLHFNINEQSMRHHQFQDSMNNKDIYYEGVVRPQLQSIPIDERDIAMETPKIKTQSNSITNESKPITKNLTTITTECNVQVEITTQSSRENGTIIAPQKDMATASTGLIGNIELLRRLGGKHFQSYTTALFATVAVGCFLLVLNILIFAGIYHQREKRVRDTKKREVVHDNEYTDTIMKHDASYNINDTNRSNYTENSKGKTSITVDDYNYYDEKANQYKNQIVMENLSNVIDTSSTLDMNWECSTKSIDLLNVKQYGQPDNNTDIRNVKDINAAQSIENILCSNTVHEMPIHGTKEKSNLDIPNHLNISSIQLPKEICFEDIENISIPEPPPPPKLFHPNMQQQVAIGGILRQSNTNSGTQVPNSRKRVHIKEISV